MKAVLYGLCTISGKRYTKHTKADPLPALLPRGYKAAARLDRTRHGGGVVIAAQSHGHSFLSENPVLPGVILLDSIENFWRGWEGLRNFIAAGVQLCEGSKNLKLDLFKSFGGCFITYPVRVTGVFLEALKKPATNTEPFENLGHLEKREPYLSLSGLKGRG